jgi:hypothetical protein
VRKIAGFTVFAAAILAGSPGCFGANSIAWGSVVAGMRLGIDFAPASPSGPMLRVSLQNAGPGRRNVIIGYKTGQADMYSLMFFATAPSGKQRKGFDATKFKPIFGVVQPIIAHLEPGAIMELLLPLHDIICIEKPGDLRMDRLVREGNSLRAVFEANADMNQPGQTATQSLWTGKLTSGELAQPK